MGVRIEDKEAKEETILEGMEAREYHIWEKHHWTLKLEIQRGVIKTFLGTIDICS